MATATSKAAQSEEPKAKRRPVGGSVPRPWREGTLTRARELEVLWAWVVCKDPPEHYQDLAAGLLEHLKAARQAAEGEKLHPTK